MSSEESKGEVVRWADGAMFKAEEMPFDVNETGPRVTIINATPQPLASIAAMSMMYEGKVARSLSDIGPDQRRHYFEQIKKTHLKAPFESVQFHFLVEGVTRSFTHQMVRQRTAVYAQESLRFAVKEGFAAKVARPPSLAGTTAGDSLGAEESREQYARNVWDQAVEHAEQAYLHLVEAGMPAEDARGLLPHNVTTRLHYVTNLRALQEHAGMRLCTQAQFEWRMVWASILRAISGYKTPGSATHFGEHDNWEFREIASLFRPVCYLTGKCEFNASFDRKCSIKARVDANHDIGRSSADWGKEYNNDSGSHDTHEFGLKSVIRDGDSDDPVFIGAIHPAEWMLDPSAAR